MKPKLILIMIDGISSDYFIDYPQFMPHTHLLAQNNTVLTNLTPEKCGSSLPGRTSILTGQQSKTHGIYGNFIWDKQNKSFRYSTPYDVRSETIFSKAKRHGLETANLGFGMIKPEDCSLYQPPHWVKDFVSRARDNTPIPISENWRKALLRIDDGRLEICDKRLCGLNNEIEDQIGNPLFNELLEDQQMIQRLNLLLESAHTPDLIFTEINATDSAQHQFGYATKVSNFVISYADMLVGSIVQKLKSTGQDTDYSIIVTSDHGHGNTEGAVFVNNIIDENNWNSECSILFLENNRSIGNYTNQLKPLATEVLDDSFLPDDVRGHIIPFATKEKTSFELASQGCNDLKGVSKYKSSHSYFPGTQSDKRFAVINCPNPISRFEQNGTPEQLYESMNLVLQIA